MRKGLIAAGVVVLAAVVIIIVVLGGHYHSGPVGSGRGTIVNMDYDPAKFYTAKECQKKFKRPGDCRTPRIKEREDWDLTYVDERTGEHVEKEISKAVYDRCRIGYYFNGSTCS